MAALRTTNSEMARIETDERRKWISAAISKCGILSKRDVSDSLMINIDETIQLYKSKISSESTARTNHDAVRQVVTLAQASKSTVCKLRLGLLNLPVTAKLRLNERARRCWLQVFPTDPAAPADIGSWFQTAPPDLLVEAVLAFAVEGGKRVKGRQRLAGKRSADRVEPVIMGRVRGDPKFAGGDAPSGGRPSKGAVDDLVMWLANDWANSTGLSPDRGRSDRTPFGELVHHVFGWLEINEPADAALRRYWEAVGDYKVEVI